MTGLRKAPDFGTPSRFDPAVDTSGIEGRDVDIKTYDPVATGSLLEPGVGVCLAPPKYVHRLATITENVSDRADICLTARTGGGSAI